MMIRQHFHIIALAIVALLFSGCTEQYALQTSTFDEALVVEGTITNELKQQQIKISRTFRFEQNDPVYEKDAEVTVTDDAGNTYAFEENAGKYRSTTAFQAEPGKTYRLKITTADGKTYSSSGQKLSAINEMQSVVPTVQVKDGQKGVAIIVNSFDAQGNSKFYRYEYEETFKVIAPEWNPNKAILLPPLEGSDHEEIGIVPRNPGETKTCYTTNRSSDIIQTSTIGLQEDRVNFPVRFIGTNNYIISHRYSILVRQYVQSLEAYTFYKTLKQLSTTGGNILSQHQPGFFYGNLRCDNNPQEKVVGFFEVTSVSSKRIFFNYADLFPDDPLPPYIEDCSSRLYGFCFVPENPECRGWTLISDIRTNSLLYAGDATSPNGYQVYYMVPPPCGDCTKISSNVIPPFWID
jgi:hypothetical protein